MLPISLFIFIAVITGTYVVLPNVFAVDILAIRISEFAIIRIPESLNDVR